MTAPRTPNWRLNSSFYAKREGRDSVVIPAGSYVRPIDRYYIPAHVKESYPFFDPKVESFIYTKFGIFVIPNTYLEET